MPAQDTKITALAAIGANPINVATFPIPMVDLLDNSMAASGTTKKVTVNQILGAGGTATLASATITGDLTVRTNQLIANANGVGVGTAPSAWSGIGPAIQVEQASLLSEASNQLYLTANGYFSGGQWNYINNASADQYYQIAGSHVWRSGIGGAGGTAIGWSTLMTLNATGLGVGVVSANGIKLSSFVTTDGAPATSGTTQTSGSLRIGAVSTTGAMDMGTAGSYSWIQVLDRGNLATNYDLVLQKNGGNVGIGVASPSNLLEAQETGTGSGLGGIVSSTATVGGNAGYVFRTGGTNRWSLSLTGSAGAESIRFYDVNNSATRLTIDSSGNVISNVTGTAPTLATNSQMVFNLTSNTNLRISVRGTDGVTRTANITLA